jgi:hypothetical protein
MTESRRQLVRNRQCGRTGSSGSSVRSYAYEPRIDHRWRGIGEQTVERGQCLDPDELGARLEEAGL